MKPKTGRSIQETWFLLFEPFPVHLKICFWNGKCNFGEKETPQNECTSRILDKWLVTLTVFFLFDQERRRGLRAPTHGKNSACEGKPEKVWDLGDREEGAFVNGLPPAVKRTSVDAGHFQKIPHPERMYFSQEVRHRWSSIREKGWKPRWTCQFVFDDLLWGCIAVRCWVLSFTGTTSKVIFKFFILPARVTSLRERSHWVEFKHERFTSSCESCWCCGPVMQKALLPSIFKFFILPARETSLRERSHWVEFKHERFTSSCESCWCCGPVMQKALLPSISQATTSGRFKKRSNSISSFGALSNHSNESNRSVSWLRVDEGNLETPNGRSRKIAHGTGSFLCLGIFFYIFLSFTWCQNHANRFGDSLTFYSVFLVQLQIFSFKF